MANKKVLGLDPLIVAMVSIHGVYGALEQAYGLSLPVRPILIAVALLLVIVTFYYAGHEGQIKCLIGVSFIGSELIMFAIPLILLPRVIHSILLRWPQAVYRRWSIPVLSFLLLAFFQLVISAIREFSLFTILFWFLTFGFGFMLFIYYTEKHYTEEEAFEIISFLRKLIVLQIAILLLQFLIHRQWYPGDPWNGSFLDSDKTGMYLTLVLLLYLVPPLLSRNEKMISLLSVNKLTFMIVLAVFIILCDAKIKSFLLLMGVFVFAMLFVFAKVRKGFGLISYRKAFVISVLGLCSLFVLTPVGNFYLKYISKSPETVSSIVSQYTVEPSPEMEAKGINGKFLLYKKVFVEMWITHPVKWFWGEGPGKFDGRASNMLAYDILYKYPGQFRLPSFIPPYSSPLVKEYMTGMWDQDKSKFVNWISANLSFPFAGWITIKGEMGIPGMIMFLVVCLSLSFHLIRRASALLMHSAMRNWALALGIFWISLPIMMVVDTIQEKPQIMYPIYLVTAVLLACDLKSGTPKPQNG